MIFDITSGFNLLKLSSACVYDRNPTICQWFNAKRIIQTLADHQKKLDSAVMMYKTMSTANSVTFILFLEKH